MLNSKILCISLALLMLFLTACGGGGGSDPEPPVANAASFTIDEDNTLTQTLSGTASEGGNLSFQISTEAQNGTLTLVGNEFEYEPNANFFGTDQFRFQVTEGELNSPPAVVSITVNAVNDAPVVNNDSIELMEDGTYQGMLPASDIDNNELDFVLISNTSHGELVVNTDGSYTYTPNENYFGEDEFEFTASDSEFTSAPASVAVSITSVNDAPVSESLVIDLIAGRESSFELVASDVDGDSLTFAITNDFEKAVISNDPSSSGLIEVTAPYGTYGSDNASFTSADQTDTSNEATIDVNISLAASQASSTAFTYDAGGQLVPLSVIQDNQENTLVVGNVRGEIGVQGASTPSQRFLSVHNSDNELIKTVYFGQGQSEYESSLLVVEQSTPTLLGIAGNEAYFITFDDNYDVALNRTHTIPYAIDRENVQLTPVHVPGVGYYIIGNDNQLTWINTEGDLRSTESIANEMGYQINRWDVLDVKVIEEIVYIAGRFSECDDQPTDCFSGLGQGSFVLTANQSGVPATLNELQPQYADDLAIMNNGQIVQQFRQTLSLMELDGSIVWQRFATDGDVGNVAVGPDNDILWWNLDRETGNSLASRINEDNSVEWQTNQSSGVVGHYWDNHMLVDEFGNMYISFVDRYNQDADAFGAFVTMHFDYAGSHQWTERQQPSDLNPNTNNSAPWSILTEDNRILAIVGDNINAGGSDSDGFLLEIKVVEVE